MAILNIEIKAWLSAAGHILEAGNPNVILYEREIKSPSGFVKKKIY